MKVDRSSGSFTITPESEEEAEAVKEFLRNFPSLCEVCGQAIRGARYKIAGQMYCNGCGDAEIFVQREMGKL